MTDWSNYAIIGGIVALWSQIRGVFDRIRALLVTRITLDGEVARSVRAYLCDQGRVWDWGDRYIYSVTSFVRPLDRVTDVAIEGPPRQARIVWLRGRPLFFSSTSQDSGRPHDLNLLHLSYLRWSVDIVQLTRDAMQMSMAKFTTGQRYRVHRVIGRQRHDIALSGATESAGFNRGIPMPTAYIAISPSDRALHWSQEELGAQMPEKPFQSLVLDCVGLAAKEEFERWLKMKTWYKERGIPWRRGFLLQGEPGTGKTSLARALAQSADMPVFAFDLATLSNSEFSREWEQMQEQTPCMALLEDIDACFYGRENRSKNQDALTFDCLLNAIGGIQSADGVFLVVTTNHPESLDPALTRPGRIDRIFTLAKPAEEARAQILKRISGTTADIQETAGMTAAEVTEFAVQKALRDAWNSADSTRIAG